MPPPLRLYGMPAGWRAERAIRAFCLACRLTTTRARSPLSWSSARALWFLKLTNAGDTLAYNAATIATVRGLAPLPGRALKTGIRVDF